MTGVKAWLVNKATTLIVWGAVLMTASAVGQIGAAVYETVKRF